MEAKDLMIGDWLIPYNETEPRRIEKLGYQYDMAGKYDIVAFCHNPYTFNYIGFYRPVLITPENLEKNGFAYHRNNGAFVAYAEESYNNQTVEISLFHVKNEYNNIQLHICESCYPEEVMMHLMECNYIHELQHAFRVCGIKKDIEL